MNVIKSYLKHTLRSGRLFWSYLEELEETAKYSKTELEAYQNEKLCRIIKVAYENIPFYRKIFKERNLVPSDIKISADLYKLPVIDKKTVRDNFSDFKNKNFHMFKYRGYTSGTTGTPGVFWRDLTSINFENAVITLQQKWAGVSYKDRRIWLRGDYIIPMEQQVPPFWKFNSFEHQLIMSSYHLSNKTFPYFINKIKQFSPRLLQAYPSSSFILAKHLEKIDDYLKIPIIQTSSEILYPERRELIEKRFNAKIFDYYGVAERVTIGIECQAHQGLHLVSGYGITETIEPEQKYAGNNDMILVGTTLNNYLMPLIRYKTDDLIKYYSDDCPCGCKFPRIYPVETKLEDIILTADGRYINPSLLTFILKQSKNIEFSQIIQQEDGNFTVKIVKAKDYCDKDANLIFSKMGEIVGKLSKVELEYVKEIPRGNNGKYHWVISHKNKAMKRNS